jgi:hypothetical protein
VGELDRLGIEAYLYAYPLVTNLEQVLRYEMTGIGANPAAPFNTFSHARTLTTAADIFVSINNDTVYSMAQLDLSVGEVRLSVPASDRYYVLQFVDAWTDNFAYVGTRATGNAGGEYLIVPPGWDGDDGGRVVIHSPSRIASIVGRWACSGVDDLPAVHRLQDALVLEPASAEGGSGIPATGPQGSAALAFWEKFRVWSQAFAPAPSDTELQASFAPLGLTGTSSVDGLAEEIREVLTESYVAGAETLDKIVTGGGSSVKVNGWSMTLHVFDFNLDYYEVGALDDPAWKLTDPKIRIAERAGSARGGLWGNHGYEAAYAMTWTDADGQTLTGADEYDLTLSPPPPVGAFWSVTMYSLPDYYLVGNEIDRYSIGDRTSGLVTDDRGGVTIRMSRARPADPDVAANWLPTPEGAFRPILRMYIPDKDILDGTYQPAAITRRG